jgi:electron transfer flavoprotein alpha subunit
MKPRYWDDDDPMNKVAILVEMKNGRVKPAGLGIISAAHGSHTERIGFVLEKGTPEAREQLEDHGIDTIVEIAAADGPIPWNPEHWACAVVQAMRHYDTPILLGLASQQGKNILPRVAARLEAALVMDCTAVDLARHTAVKSQFSGKTVAEFKTCGAYHLYGIRPNALDAAPVQSTAETEVFQAVIENTGLTVIEVKTGQTDHADLSEADVIISGGRGMMSAENFNILSECARTISAAVGASRVAVDAGWVPHSMQVGQTGKTVSPKVYIACGISGSVQHFAGMKTSGIIIAINTDPNAAIMTKCDYAVCADLFDVIPALTEKLKTNAT